MNLNDKDFVLSVDRVILHPGSKSYTLRHKFKNSGLIPIYVEVIDKNQRFSKKATGMVNVSQYCLRPQLSVKPNSQLLFGFRSEKIYISVNNFDLKFNCVTTSVVYTKFVLYKYVNYTTRDLGEDITSNISLIKKSDGLHIEPLQLETGYYAVVFTLGMGTAESGNLNLANSKSLDLQVLGTDFTAKFQSGSYKQVRISDQVSSIVEVKNPDQPDDLSGYFFTWFCYQYEVESGWAKDNVKLPSDADRIAIPSDGMVIYYCNYFS